MQQVRRTRLPMIVIKNKLKPGRAVTPLGVMANSTGANNQRLKRYVGPNDTAYDVTMTVNYHLYNF